jgi:hypothetical protein
MSLLETYGKEIVALIVPLITWALNNVLKAKAKLLAATPHSFTFLVQEPLRDAQGNQLQSSQTVHTRSLMIWNAGKETATPIEWAFNWKPLCINFWPSRHFEEHLEPDGRYIIIFPSLAPNEYLGCELFTINSPLPNLITIRSDQCVAQNIVMFPQPLVPTWKRRLNSALALAGLALVIYAALLLLQFLVLKTPFH